MSDPGLAKPFAHVAGIETSAVVRAGCIACFLLCLVVALLPMLHCEWHRQAVAGIDED